MERFTAYRKNVPTDTHNEVQRRPPDEPQFMGVIFENGTVVVQWQTAGKSIAIWDSFENMLAIHGHPEYGTYMKFHDGPPPIIYQQMILESETA